jgi:hypothetical protein
MPDGHLSAGLSSDENVQIAQKSSSFASSCADTRTLAWSRFAFASALRRKPFVWYADCPKAIREQ